MKILIAASMLALSMAANPLAAQAQTLRLAFVNKASEPQGQGFEKFAELTNKYTDGRVTVKVFPGGTLGSDRELFNQLTTGAIDMGKPSFPILADVVPEYSVFLAGYFFNDYRDQQRLLQSPKFGQKWNAELLKEAGLRVIGQIYQGVRDVTLASGEPRSPAQFKGIKLRAVPNPMALAVVSGLGASPTPVAFPELFQALSQHVVDGQENPLPTIYANHFYEVQHTLILTDHQIASQPVVINEKAWEKLSAKDQKGLLRALHEAMDWTTKQVDEQQKTLVAKLKAKGMKIVILTPAQKTVFKKAVQASVLKAFDGKAWPKGFGQSVIDFVAKQ